MINFLTTVATFILSLFTFTKGKEEACPSVVPSLATDGGGGADFFVKLKEGLNFLKQQIYGK